MSTFRGNALVVEWIYSGGTVNLSGQYRTLEMSAEADMLDNSSGSVSTRTFQAGLKQGSYKYSGLHNGTGSPLGTADLAALVEGTSGTIRVSPLGTASTSPRTVQAAIVKSCNQSFPYDALAEVEVEWQGSGDITRGAW